MVGRLPSICFEAAGTVLQRPTLSELMSSLHMLAPALAGNHHVNNHLLLLMIKFAVEKTSQSRTNGAGIFPQIFGRGMHSVAHVIQKSVGAVV